MPNLFHVNVDLTALDEFKGHFKTVVEKEMRGAVNKLTAMTHAHIIEEANKKLHTRRQMFIDAVTWYADQSGQFFVIQLDAKARWIDDGMLPHNMIDDLLKSDKAKVAKDGSRYLSVPFEHGGGPTQNTPSQLKLLSEIRGYLKQAGIPYKKIEKDENGAPKLGLLHAFDIGDKPLKEDNGLHGQGQGPVGAVMQGWSPDKQSGIPLLHGVQVHQKMGKGKKGEDIVKRAIMTFRIVSSKHKEQSGRWDHPGLDPVHIFDEAADWAKKTWENEVAPNVIGKLVVDMR